jgi:hypothetical protein
MKKLIFILAFLPLFSYASDEQTSERNYSSEEFQQQDDTTIQMRCGSGTSGDCWGKSVGSPCILNYPPNMRWGSCRQLSNPDPHGQVSCVCI